MKYKSSQYCPNCHFPLPYKAKFCARCGQKSDDGRVSLGALLKQVWYRMLHLESRSLRFMWLVFIPGFVTQEFFNGRRQRYPHPIRFFFIVAFLFLFTVNHLVNLSGFQAKTGTEGVKISKSIKGKESANFYDTAKRYAELTTMRQEFDSLPPEYRTPLVQKAVDSLLQRSYGDAAEKLREIWVEATDSLEAREPDSLFLNLGARRLQVAMLDVFRMDAESIAEKYGVSSWFEKILLRQGLKALETPDALMKAFLGSLAWTLLALVALMSGVLTLLYWRQKRYYVEHFIFLLNEHSSMLLLLLPAIAINSFYPLESWWAPLLFWFVLSPFIAMKRYYRQGFWITLLKFLAFSLAYLLGFILLFAVGLLVVFVVF